MERDEREVQVWCADPDELLGAGRAEAAQRLLAADERERAGSFHFERDRRIYLATRVLVRSVLSRYAPVAPEDLRRWHEEGREVLAEFEGEPNLDSGVAHRVEPEGARA
jgi:hypothetical protein